MKYRILSAADVASLEEQVWDALKEGWKLQGGVACAQVNDAPVWAQAIVRVE